MIYNLRIYNVQFIYNVDAFTIYGFTMYNLYDYPQSYHQRDRNAVFALVTEGTSVASTPG